MQGVSLIVFLSNFQQCFRSAPGSVRNAIVYLSTAGRVLFPASHFPLLLCFPAAGLLLQCRLVRVFQFSPSMTSWAICRLRYCAELCQVRSQVWLLCFTVFSAGALGYLPTLPRCFVPVVVLMPFCMLLDASRQSPFPFVSMGLGKHFILLYSRLPCL